MAGPITWRNVGNDTNHLAAAQIIDMSRRTLSGALDSVGGVINKTEQINNNNIAALDEAAKQAYLDQVAGARTTGQMTTLQSSGALDNALAQLSTAARAEVRGAGEARASALYSRERGMVLDGRNDQTYQDSREDRTYTVNRRGITDSRADTRWGWDQGDRTYLETVTRPSTEATNRRQAQLGELTLTEAQRAAAEAERQRGLDRVVTDLSNNRQSSLQGMREGVDSGLTDFSGKLPRNTDGTLALDRFTDADRAAANAHLQKKELPTLDDLRSSDTAARANVIARLREAGATPADLARLDPSITAGVTTIPVGPIGREAAAIDRNQRIQEFNTKMDGALYAPMTTPGAVKEAYDAGIKAVDSRIPAGWERDNWRQAILEMTRSGGIVAKGKDGKPIVDADGQPIRVVPGATAIEQIVIGADRGSIGWGAGDINKAIKKWVEDGANQIGAGKAVKNQLLLPIQNINQEKPVPKK
jgi:hypothetical protein